MYGAIRDEAGGLEGAINVVFRMDELAAVALDHLDEEADGRGRDLWIVDLATGEPVWGAVPAVIDERVFRSEVRVADRTWELRTADRPAVPPIAHLLAMFLSVLGASLMAGTAGLRARLRARVRREEVERAHMADRLREGERLESIGRLAGGVAHDFNNVLTIITGSAEILRDDLGEESALRAEAAAILDAAERGSLLTRQLLTFAKREPVQGGSVDLVAHMKNLEPMLRHAAGRDVVFELALPSAPITVAFSPASLDRVALNLVTNAGEAMEHEGELSVTVQVEGETGILRVRDDGPGMSPEVRTRIFEPFFTTRSEGTGLGLATVYGLVEAAGGTVEVESHPGAGTLFEVRLPVAHPTGAFDAAPEIHDEVRLLVVDDEVLVRRVILRSLRRRGYTVDEAHDGLEALELLEELAAGDSLPTVLITDVRMPNMDGLTLVKRVQERWPDLPVLIVSGFTDAAAETASLLGESIRFLDKPFETAQLASTVAELIEVARARRAGSADTAAPALDAPARL